MFKTFIIGNLTSNPERKATQSGKGLAIFTIAVNSGYGEHKKTNYIKCLAWDKLADVVLTWLHKGDKAMVIGEIFASPYMGKDGQPKATMEINVRELEFLSNKGQQEDALDDGDLF